MMPRMDGLEVCRRIRKAGNTPVMMLTAKGETFDKVLGLELGADDYMVKPFDAKEVVARIKAVLRRCQTTSAAASCWTRCGALSITATAVPSTSTSSACAKSWPVLPTSGS